jgi:rubrerythrin
MEGGIRAWHGMVATGTFEAGMAYFPPGADTREIVALAWAMEEGSRRFYRGAGEQLQFDPAAAELFRQLVEAEDGHKHRLMASYERFAGHAADPASWAREAGAGGDGAAMEGGVPVQEALGWLKGRELVDILDLAMSLEINAYDLYIKIGRQADDEKAKRIFAGLARDEQQHLAWMGQLLDGRL